MIDKLLGHYRIATKLGEGGMGVVYRAHDEVLRRDVAIKVVGEALADEARSVLLREARAASALNHPNICIVHEVNETDGVFYLVMELVEGATLNSLIPESGLPFQTVMRYGVQIASALAHAHGRNIAHRDLKSHNVVVTPEGLIKVLDFGLARRLVASHDETQSMRALESASTGGTLSYMSPEVLRGEPGDHRSDLWALGILLYEAAAGAPPFQGRTSFELSSKIMSEPPPALAMSIPSGLAAIIQRCLAKEPAQRYQRASEVQAALEAVQSAAAIGTEASAGPRPPVTTVHHGIRHLSVKNGDILLLVGTTKGLFLLRSNPKRVRWDVAGPYFHGQATYALAFDGRQGRHCLWVATSSMLWGTFLRSSDDYGRTWSNPQEAPIRFPADSGLTLKNIWQIYPGPVTQPNVLYCGVEPAALYVSNDDGKTWGLVRGLSTIRTVRAGCREWAV